MLALSFALGMYFAPRPFVVDNRTTEELNLDMLAVPHFGKPTKELYNEAHYEMPLRCSGTGGCGGNFIQGQPFWLIPLIKRGKEVGVVAYCLHCVPQPNGAVND